MILSFSVGFFGTFMIKLNIRENKLAKCNLN